MGVYIGQSTRIYDRATGEVSYGRIPAGSVVVAGNLPSADGKYSLYLRGDRQARGRPDPCQNQPERPVARLRTSTLATMNRLRLPTSELES